MVHSKSSEKTCATLPHKVKLCGWRLVLRLKRAECGRPRDRAAEAGNKWRARERRKPHS